VARAILVIEDSEKGHIRADARTAAIPVVALTAFAMKEDRERFLQPDSMGILPAWVSLMPVP
jgi:CheY-like chemotaxis protein